VILVPLAVIVFLTSTKVKTDGLGLAHGNVHAFVQLGPAYVGSLVLRAPFALIPNAWGGSSRETYLASALPCMFVVVAFCTWLATQPRRRGGITWASRLGPILFCLVNPVLVMGLLLGHPEEALGAVLCVGAVILAVKEKAGWAGLLLGLAVINKSWALVAVPVVLAVAPANRRWVLFVATSTTGALLLTVLLMSGNGVSATAAGTQTGTFFFPSQLLWWLGRHSWIVREAHVGIVLVAVGCAALWRSQRVRPRSSRDGMPDALLLLALVFLLRAALDPWNNIYYHVPFLFALIAYEVRSGRAPLLTAAYTLLIYYAVLVKVPTMSPDVRAALYAAIVVPMIVWLAARLFLPTSVWDRIVRFGGRQLSRRIRVEDATIA